MSGRYWKIRLTFTKHCCLERRCLTFRHLSIQNFFKSFALAPDEERSEVVQLSAPTLFQGHASQIPISTYLAFRELLRAAPTLRGLAFTYSSEEEQDAKQILSALELSDKITLQPFTRPIFRYFELVRSCKLALFLPHALIQGRTALVCACLGIPLIASNEIETHRRLFPETSLRWYAPAATSELSKRLLNDPVFAGAVTAHASQAVEYYSIENCRKRLFDGLGITASI